MHDGQRKSVSITLASRITHGIWKELNVVGRIAHLFVAHSTDKEVRAAQSRSIFTLEAHNSVCKHVTLEPPPFKQNRRQNALFCFPLGTGNVFVLSTAVVKALHL